jgi:molecular chaperone GrpE
MSTNNIDINDDMNDEVVASEDDMSTDDVLLEDDVFFEEEDLNADESASVEHPATPAAMKRLREKLKVAVKEKQEYLDGWQRAKADLVNVKREHEEMRARLMHMGKSAMIEDLLSVADSFDMAFGNKEAWEKVESEWRTGVEYIYAQFKRVLDDHGITVINPKGEVFDPARHDAVETVAVDTQDDDGKVAEVVSKGYLFDGKVLRAARVKVGECTA